MENQKKFSGSLFGFKKEDVNTYIVSLSQKYAAQIEELTHKNNELTKKNNELSKRVADLEHERAFISDTLLKAKRQGEAIIEDAEAEARRRQAELELELQKIRAIISEETQRLATLRSSAKAALSQYAENLDTIEV